MLDRTMCALQNPITLPETLATCGWTAMGCQLEWTHGRVIQFFGQSDSHVWMQMVPARRKGGNYFLRDCLHCCHKSTSRPFLPILKMFTWEKKIALGCSASYTLPFSRIPHARSQHLFETAIGRDGGGWA